jgi:hypothetical protein
MRTPLAVGLIGFGSSVQNGADGASCRSGTISSISSSESVGHERAISTPLHEVPNKVIHAKSIDWIPAKMKGEYKPQKKRALRPSVRGDQLIEKAAIITGE